MLLWRPHTASSYNTDKQYATFFFLSCEGVGRGEECKGLYTLPLLDGAPQGGSGDSPVVRTWTITSVHGDRSPLEITVQVKVRNNTQGVPVGVESFLNELIFPVLFLVFPRLFKTQKMKGKKSKR